MDPATLTHIGYVTLRYVAVKLYNRITCTMANPFRESCVIFKSKFCIGYRGKEIPLFQGTQTLLA